MGKQIRFLCPFCGLHPRAEDLKRVAEENPGVKVFEVELGGKELAEKTDQYKKVGRGRAPGKVKWTEISDAALLQQATEHFKKRVKKVEKKLNE